MKVALLYWAWNGDSEYGNIFNDTMDEWRFPLDPSAQLPVGSIIHMQDEKTGYGLDFEVIRWRYWPDENFLCLQVETTDTMEGSPEDFFEYIIQNWIPGAKIEEWLKVP